MEDNQMNWTTGLLSSNTSPALGKNQTTGFDIRQAPDARFVTFTDGSAPAGTFNGGYRRRLCQPHVLNSTKLNHSTQKPPSPFGILRRGEKTSSV